MLQALPIKGLASGSGILMKEFAEVVLTSPFQVSCMQLP